MRVDRLLDDARFADLAPLSRMYCVHRSPSLPYVRCDRLRPSKEAGALQLLPPFLSVVTIRVLSRSGFSLCSLRQSCIDIV